MLGLNAAGPETGSWPGSSAEETLLDRVDETLQRDNTDDRVQIVREEALPHALHALHRFKNQALLVVIQFDETIAAFDVDALIHRKPPSDWDGTDGSPLPATS